MTSHLAIIFGEEAEMKQSDDPMSAVAPTNDTRSMTPETLRKLEAADANILRMENDRACLPEDVGVTEANIASIMIALAGKEKGQ